MIRSELQDLMAKVFDEVRHINNTKGVEYATDRDALQNFKDGLEFGITPYQNLMVALNKHYRSIQAFVKNGAVSSNEPIEGRINDLILYSILLRALVQESRDRRIVDATPAEVQRPRPPQQAREPSP